MHNFFTMRHSLMKGHSKLRTRANYILLGTIFLYAFVFMGQFLVTGPAFEALYWCVQSALIGSIADWFAVTALFRKPLGFPYHTALIPRNKDRLIKGLVNMVETKLLTKERCESMLNKVDFLAIIERYVTTEAGQRALRLMIHQGLHMLWHTRSYQEWSALGAGKLRQFLRGQSLVPVVKHILLDLCEHNRYEPMVVQVIGVVQERLNHPAMISWLTQVIQEEINKKKHSFLSDFILSFSEATDIVNARDLAISILHEVHNHLSRWKVSQSEERRLWLRQWVEPIKSMDENLDVCLVLDAAWQRWIDEQDWEGILETYVCTYIGQMIMRGGESGQTPARIAEEMILHMWKEYGKDPLMRSRLDGVLHSIARYILEQGYGLLGTIIMRVLQGLSTERFIYFVESKVEDDLAWIRINGAFVGAICGLLVWIFLYYVYEPLLLSVW